MLEVKLLVYLKKIDTQTQDFKFAYIIKIVRMHITKFDICIWTEKLLLQNAYQNFLIIYYTLYNAFCYFTM